MRSYHVCILFSICLDYFHVCSTLHHLPVSLHPFLLFTGSIPVSSNIFTCLFSSQSILSYHFSSLFHSLSPTSLLPLVSPLSILSHSRWRLQLSVSLLHTPNSTISSHSLPTHASQVKALRRIKWLLVTHVLFLVDLWLLSQLTNYKCIFYLKSTSNTQPIYAYFQGISNKQYICFWKTFFCYLFFTRPPLFLPVHIRLSRPNDGWTGLCIKLCSQCILPSYIAQASPFPSLYLIPVYPSNSHWQVQQLFFLSLYPDPSLSPTLPLSHSLTLPLSHSPTLPLSHSPTLSLSLSPTLSLSHSLTLPLSHSPSLPLSHSPTLSLSLSPTLSLSHSLSNLYIILTEAFSVLWLGSHNNDWV